MQLNLLNVDNKLIALQLRPLRIFSITDNLPNQTIKQIVFNNNRFAILTTTRLYYLYVKTKFELVDLTANIRLTVDIKDITFISNSNNDKDNIGIFTKQEEVFTCEIVNDNFYLIKHIFHFADKNIVAISNNEMGYIHKRNDKYIVEQFNCFHRVVDMSIFDKLPTQFITPKEFLLGNVLVHHETTAYGNITNNYHNKVDHVYNRYFHVRKNKIHATNWNPIEKHSFGEHITDDCEVLNIGMHCEFKLLLVVATCDNSKNIEVLCKSVGDPIRMHVMELHYCAINLPQYTNNVVDIPWTPENHKMFGTFVDKFMFVVLKSHKYGKFCKFLPRRVLYYLLQFAL